jgi:hypothetical protein
MQKHAQQAETKLAVMTLAESSARKPKGLMALKPNERAAALMKKSGAQVVVLWEDLQYDYFGTTDEFQVFTADPADLNLLQEGPFLLAPRKPLVLVGREREKRDGLLITEHMTKGKHGRERAHEIGELCLKYLAAQRKKHGR